MRACPPPATGIKWKWERNEMKWMEMEKIELIFENTKQGNDAVVTFHHK